MKKTSILLFALLFVCVANAQQDSCQNPNFQLALKEGNYSASYWKNGRVIVLNDSNAVCGGSMGYSIHKKQVRFSKLTGKGEVLWSKTFGDTARLADVFALQPAPDGGFAAVTLIGDGYYTVEQSGVMKISKDGDLHWYRHFLSDSAEFLLRDLVCNPDGSIVACGRTHKNTEGDVLAIKFDQNGDVVWEKRYRAAPGSGREGVSIARTANGGYIIAGNKTGSNNWDCIVLNLDENGTIIWSRLLASPQHHSPHRVKVHTDGSILLAGHTVINDIANGWLARLQPNGQLLWSKFISLPGEDFVSLYDFEKGPGKYFTAVGLVSEGKLPVGKEKGGIFRFDSTGKVLWIQKFHNPHDLLEDCHFVDIEPAPGNKFYIQGHDNINYPNYARGRWLLKTNSAGFTGVCAPDTLIPYVGNYLLNVSAETYTPQAPPPLESSVIPVYNKSLEVDTLCAPECKELTEICANGIDDDENGLIDCLDPDCELPALEIETTICPGEIFMFKGIAFPADTTAVFTVSGGGIVCDSVFTVKIHSYPSPSVLLPHDTTVRVGSTLILSADVSGAGNISLNWSPADGLSCTTCADPSVTLFETISYTLAVTDSNNCTVQDSVLLTVDPDCVIIIPNAFTPNDDGVNDYFYPKANSCVRRVRKWQVISRWGEKVFELQNFDPGGPSSGWDGNRANGEPFPSDVLVWYAEFELYDGRVEVRKGDVALLR
jgi:gliding motility-associated-like protein